ncbi:hypothetical protein M758_7G122700 [Ceratodon purpureus]|nr:hypothetical protein M758_7G122700 [Ceratodon purpureus]
MGGHKSGSDSDSGSGSDDERKHSKHDKKDKKDKHDKKDKKDDKHKDDKHKEDKHKGEKHDSGHGSGSLGSRVSGSLHDIMPGHEKYQGKLKKEDVQDLKHRTDISDEEREHRRKVLMAEVAAGVVGTGILGFAGYQAYQHFGSKDEENKAVEHKTE